MRTIQKVHCGFIVVVNDLKTQGVIFKVFNTRRQQTEETYHITFDESPDAIKFSKPSVDNINIAENERYPPNEYLHPYEPSQRTTVGNLTSSLNSSSTLLTEEEGWIRIEEYVQYQDDMWDDMSPPMNIFSISETMQPTFRGHLKRACNQISYHETPSREFRLKNPYLICDYCGGSHEADECKQLKMAEQVCLSGGDIYDDPSFLRSKVEDELTNFMLEKKSYTKGIGDMLVQHRKELRGQYSQILSTINKDPSFPTPPRPATDSFTEGETKKEGPEGAEPSITQKPTPWPSILYQPSKTSNLPFPSILKKQKKDDEDERLLLIFKQIYINLPFLEAMIHMPKGAKVLKDLLLHKEKLKKAASSVKLSEECSAIIQRSLPQKEGDSGSFTLPCLIGPLAVKNTLSDLGASINLMPHSLFRRLGISKLKPTKMSIQLADRSIKYPIGVCENLLVKIDSISISRNKNMTSRNIISRFYLCQQEREHNQQKHNQQERYLNYQQERLNAISRSEHL
ncbi:DNA-directed DNA polymerase [Tanacetum coccineum]